jgi:methylmalonyl-CoA mutase
VRAARDANLAKRKEVLTGASEFPNLYEAAASVLEATPVTLPPDGEAKVRFDALAPIRLAQPFETLRDTSEKILEKSGARPKIFLANIGSAADFTARATFAKSFFETGGIEAVDSEGFTDPAALAAAFKASGASLACLCSSDKVYAAQAEPAAKALHGAGARHIYLAGRPGGLEAALRAAGVNDFVFAGGNALAMLSDAYSRIA